MSFNDVEPICQYIDGKDRTPSVAVRKARDEARDRMRKQLDNDMQGVLSEGQVGPPAPPRNLTEEMKEWWGDGEIEKDPEHEKEFEKFGVGPK